MHRNSGRILLIVAAFALFLVPVAAIAAGGFTDVADDNVFKADIEWLAAAGVTKGCNPPANTEFCPGDDVTREQMAAFMHRLAMNRVVDAGTVEGYTAAELMASGGTPGPVGPEGPAGPAGADGADGVDGAVGPAGPAGADGADGTDGVDGQDGAPGVDGADGADGTNGVDGQDGSPGADGADGVDGAPGADGADGADGLPGAPGADGADGTIVRFYERTVAVIGSGTNGQPTVVRVFAACDLGDTVTGGGYAFDDLGGIATQSSPLDDGDPATPSGWDVTVQVTQSNVTIAAFVRCVEITPAPQQVAP